jgi:hypothetical protein
LKYLGVWLLLTLILTACGSTEYAPRGVQFPANYRTEFVQYATVDHKDGIVRDLYIQQSSLEQLRAGYALPDGTIIVIEMYNAQRDAAGELLLDEQGRMLKAEIQSPLHIAEKRSNWRLEDFEAGQLSEDWNFGSYTVEGALFDEALTPCFNCHNTTERTDFIWSLPMIWRYQRSGDLQYFYCNAGGRSPCEL